MTFAETTAAAQRSIDASRAGSTDRRILDELRKRGERGGTDEELQLALSLGGNSQRPRRVALAKAGKVIDSRRRRRTSSGRAAIIWILSRYTTPDHMPRQAGSPPTKPKRCGWCRATDFWKSAIVPGVVTCRRCHPPATQSLEKKNTPHHDEKKTHVYNDQKHLADDREAAMAKLREFAAMEVDDGLLRPKPEPAA